MALRLLAEKPDGRRTTRVRRLLQQLTRVAGASRDWDVLFESYVQHLKQLPSRTPEQNRLRQRLADTRRRGRRRMVSDLLDLEIAKLRGDLGDITAHGAPSLLVVTQRFAELCLREGKALSDGFAQLGAVLDAEALHALRRSARRLRYAVEIYDQVSGQQSGSTKPWKMLQDLIGDLHDHHVLANWLDSQVVTDEKRGSAVLARAARAEAAWARTEVYRLHDELLAARPEAIVASGLVALGYPQPCSLIA